MYLLILLFPLLSFLNCLLLGRKIGHEGTKFLSCFLLSIACILSYIIFWDIIVYESIIYIYGWSWFNLGNLSNKIYFIFDHLVASMLILILTVSSLVHLYSTSYMDKDPHLPRFMGYLSLFTFFMIILVTSNNIVQLFIGWEGVGLCSYLLINFWFTRIQANKAAIKAMILNKVGDIGILLAMILLWTIVGEWQYSCFIPILQELKEEQLLSLCTLFLLIGVIGKSAQLGLHTWLPDAMEGPTPVSALIHAATMVTAGVFLIIRLSPLFEYTPTILLYVIIIGSLTAFFSSTIGLTQNDLKKVIAYSTCSQLGYMVLICGFSQYHLGLFHLINHGFFKALLFLSAGSIIHASTDEQDFRRMGGIRFIIPFSYICIVIGSLSLMGFPFLTGFYSKDLIIETIYGNHIYKFGLWLAVLSAFITAFYSFRLLFYTFQSFYQGNKINLSLIHESSWNLWFSLLILVFFTLIGGFSLQYFILRDTIPIILPNITKFLPLIISLLGAILAIFICYYISIRWFIIKNIIIQCFYSFIYHAWYFDKIWTYFITLPFLRLSFNQIYKYVDNQLLEEWGPFGVYNYFSYVSGKLSQFHLGSISFYVFIFILFFLSLYINI